MLPQVAADEKATKLFLREVETTKALRHPNVVQLFEAGCYQGIFFFTLEFCPLGSVDKYMIAQSGKLPIEQALSITCQVLDGLHYAHHLELTSVAIKGGKKASGRGLVHRDLKPSNIFLVGGGENIIAKVGDYGLSKAFDLAGLSGHTCAGSVAGTAQFMPRQQVLRYKFAKPEVDVWATAASLYFMLTGHFPREFKKGEDPWVTVLQTQPIPIRKRASHVPRRLASVIDKALVDDPKIGFTTAESLKAALQKAWR